MRIVGKGSRRLPIFFIRESAIQGFVDMESQQLRILLKRRFSNSGFCWYGEPATQVLLIWRGGDSGLCWYGESATQGFVDAESRRLRVLLIRRVGNSGFCWYGKSATRCVVDAFSRFSVKNNSRIWSQNRKLLTFVLGTYAEHIKNLKIHLYIAYINLTNN